MNSKERVRRTIAHEHPDRVPFDGYVPWASDYFYVVGLTPRTWQPPRGAYPQVDPLLLQLHLWKWKSFDPTLFPNGKPPKRWWNGSYEAIDEWGAYWNHIASDFSMGHPGRPVLANWDDLDTIQIPNAKDPQRFWLFSKLKKLFPHKYKLLVCDHFIFERTHFYRGFSNVLVDMARNKTKLKALIQQVTQFWLDIVDVAVELKVDGIAVPDDLGDQKTAFMSPHLFKEFLYDPYKQFVQKCHDHQITVELHSCGAINALVPLLVELGVDVLQFDSPRMTGIDFQAQWAEKITFKNVVDIQKVYPFATPAQVEEEVKVMIAKLATHNGGLIGRDYFQAEKVLGVPKLNVHAHKIAYQKWGHYPLKWVDDFLEKYERTHVIKGGKNDGEKFAS